MSTIIECDDCHRQVRNPARLPDGWRLRWNYETAHPERGYFMHRCDTCTDSYSARNAADARKRETSAAKKAPAKPPPLPPQARKSKRKGPASGGTGSLF
jgi:hypothetical protein